MYSNRDEDPGKEEFELGYKEDDNDDDDDDNKEYEDEEGEWYEISDRKFSLNPVLPIYIYAP